MSLSSLLTGNNWAAFHQSFKSVSSYIGFGQGIETFFTVWEHKIKSKN